jgi:hypothetical protein
MIPQFQQSAFVSLLLLTAPLVTSAQDKLCEPCEGGLLDETLSFDGVQCTDWYEVAGSTPAGSPQCTFDRMVGVWFCGCPVPQGVTDTCTICNNGIESYNEIKVCGFIFMRAVAEARFYQAKSHFIFVLSQRLSRLSNSRTPILPVATLLAFQLLMA